MQRVLRLARVLPALSLVFAPRLMAQTKPTIEQFMSPASPIEITAARNADRVAWMAYERGMRNVYSAAAPDFKPVRLTRFLEDDGIDLTDVELSDDGSIAVFVRGSAPNRVGWIANPSHDPAGGERAIWAVRTAGGGPAWRVAVGGSPELSPDGRYVLYVKDDQIYRARVTPTGAKTAVDTGGIPFIKEWGRQSNPSWSPDGSKIAFVSDRENHSFIGVYDSRTHHVDFLAPSVDCDVSPTWSADGKQIAFIRRPGTPFGLQAQQGAGGIGGPPGPAANGGRRGCAIGGFGGGRGQQEDTTGNGRRLQVPGLYRATFRGGYTLSVMVADVATGKARELWHNAPNDRTFATINRLIWAGDNIIFPLAAMTDEFERYYSLAASAQSPTPVMLTTTNGLIEAPTDAAISRDGKTLYYCTNAQDIERRHIWAVPTSGGTPRQLSMGEGIETTPVPLASGQRLAVLYFGAKQPASVGLLPTNGGEAKLIFPTLPKDFPVAEHVVPQIIVVQSPDSLQIHNQLFLPKDLKPGERRPALIFVHGGPPRQMLPGYHYMQFYHWAYGVNQWLASQGYVVMSVNYRSGVGYGRSFRMAANTNARGNSEYQDVLAAAKYLQTRADVDPTRVGIWGLSYGGLLTSQALARNSDVFVAGVDMAGVHLYGNALDTAAMSYRSSAISSIDKWKSPVLIVHGDDDRNVDFAQSVGLVQLLRAHNVYHELIIIPDDLHESMFHSRWMNTWNHMGTFLHRFVWNKEQATANQQ
jgi:dipeptidyl aminopeptidase/acylaminoacyl peptidase